MISLFVSFQDTLPDFNLVLDQMPQNNYHILLDSAKMGTEIITAKELNPGFDSLYLGASELSLSVVAPYLFSFQPKTEFVNWFMQNGWGNSWGVLMHAQEDMKSLRKHFRKFLMVKTENGEELYFRFYDPRVLNAFLPTCDKDQLQEFFGPVEFYICEDEDPAYANIYFLRNNELVTSKTTREQVLTVEPDENNRHKFSFF